jgi:hypothetical protein
MSRVKTIHVFRRLLLVTKVSVIEQFENLLDLIIPFLVIINSCPVIYVDLLYVVPPSTFTVVGNLTS